MYEDGTSVRQVTVGPGAEPRPDVVAGRRRARVRARLQGRPRPLRRRRRRQPHPAADHGLAPTTRRPPGARPARSRSCATATSTSSRPGAARGPLTGGVADDRDPVWSPDGRRIAFTRLAAQRRAEAAQGQEAAPVRAAAARAVGDARRRRPRAAAEEAARAASPPPPGRPTGARSRSRWAARGRRALFTLRTNGRRLRQVGSRASDPRALDWQARGARPGDRGGRRHRLRPGPDALRHRPRHAATPATCCRPRTCC